MHRHDLFPLSLIELLLSSHLGIFYALILFYTNEQPSRSAEIMLNSKPNSKPVSANISQFQSASINHNQSQSPDQPDQKPSQVIIKSAASTGRILVRSAGAAPFWRDICEEVTACISLSLFMICFIFYTEIYAAAANPFSCLSILQFSSFCASALAMMPKPRTESSR